MRVFDPGHLYSLDILDGEGDIPLRFVKRVGDKYPGNNSCYPGTTTQEVLRALIDRAIYVNSQRSCAETEACIELFKTAIFLLESRAARRHGRDFDLKHFDWILDSLAKCNKCGHIGCIGNCHD